MDAMILFSGVHKSYGSSSYPVPVLRDLSLHIDKGEFVAITGPSGSGKTTVLNLIGGLDQPEGGAVNVAGADLTSLEPSTLTRWRAAHIGFVFQSYYLLPMLTAHDNVELPLLLTRLSRAARRRTAAAALERVGLTRWARHRPGQLSGGQQQRVGIARAIVASAPVLLCDEPTAGLDRGTARSVIELLREIAAEGRTVVMVTHDAMAANAADRCIALTSAA